MIALELSPVTAFVIINLRAGFGLVSDFYINDNWEAGGMSKRQRSSTVRHFGGISMDTEPIQRAQREEASRIAKAVKRHIVKIISMCMHSRLFHHRHYAGRKPPCLYQYAQRHAETNP